MRYQASLPLDGFLLLSFFDFIPFFGLHSCVSYVSFYLFTFALQQLAVGNSQLVGTSIYFVPLSPVPADRIRRWFLNFDFVFLSLPMKAFNSSRSTQSCPCPPRHRAIYILLHKAACFIFSLVTRPASCSLPPHVDVFRSHHFSGLASTLNLRFCSSHRLFHGFFMPPSLHSFRACGSPRPPFKRKRRRIAFPTFRVLLSSRKANILFLGTRMSHSNWPCHRRILTLARPRLAPPPVNSGAIVPPIHVH